jgi:hypothetical protein
MGNKPSGTYPNGVPYDKRRSNPHHPNHLPPPRNSPTYGYPVDAWMTRAPYTTTWEFRLAQMQNRGPGESAADMERLRDIGSHAGSPAANNAGAIQSAVPMHGACALGDRSAAGLPRTSRAGSGGAMGGPVGYGIIPHAAAPGLGKVPDAPDPTVAAGSGQTGTGRFGALRGVRGPFGSQLGLTDTRIDPHTGMLMGHFGVHGPELPLFPSPEIIRQRERERRKAWRAMRGQQ